MGESVVKRSDPFDFPPSIVPVGLKYQWVDCHGDAKPSFVEMRARGWVPVPPEWHPGIWDEQATAGHDITVKNNVLMCHAKPRDEEGDRIAGAQKNIEYWAQKYGGFSGGVRMQTQTQDAISRVREIPMGEPNLARKITAPALPSRVMPEINAAIADNPPVLPPAVEFKTCNRSHRVPRHRFLRWLFRLVSMEGS